MTGDRLFAQPEDNGFCDERRDSSQNDLEKRSPTKKPRLRGNPRQSGD
ncbi:hypothetical protein LTSEALA_2501 [Salmonella enterica subsp. enterica serovar Alachua str. R6-377]|uniref:Uncharacterized protein n=1 Tax=Salmonella enterica subsp. enterica serovar Alachua str. R6-377 TaxID=913241 RepID=G5LP67_SALET|nr:hypothetical protein LTSEALA_2501 [Salmonella enterica subsp. enterica serovar Alachua str. R6-377]